jgi:hypothetical protein
MMSGRRLSLLACWAFLASLTAGCVTYGPSQRMMGFSRDQVIAELGPPRPYPERLDTARRLDFPRGPAGRHTFSVDFDDAGRATGFRQLLTEKNFRYITPGMSVKEVIDRIGIATDSFGLARNRGYVWNYRYETAMCQWFQIEFAADDTVRSAGYGIPPECRRPSAAVR